jgi:mRNA-degrading endonuclease RelE of RelBE toxin-antitoxin system
LEFRIADTFTDSLARLSTDEQKSVKTTAFDLQMNPAQPGLQFHKLDKARDKNFWSVRVSSDIRLIVHRTASSLLLCYVHHHDDAYRWAEQRKIEVHPKTGAAQLVEVRETVQEIVVPVFVSAKPLLFAGIPEDELLGYGVPAEWVPDVRKLGDEDALLGLADHLPKEAAEALLDLATGVTPKIPSPRVPDPFNHPDAQRRFRVMSNQEELERALDFPWEKWTIFLHPAQRQLIERDYNGPARVAGSAGTGKTIVALHRAVFLARANPETRVLLTTFSETLANALGAKLRALIHNEPRLGERVEVHSLDAIARRLYDRRAPIADGETITALLKDAAQGAEANKFSLHFLRSEWEQVVDAWQLESWESYRGVARLGRRTRLPENQRAVLWSIFARVRSGLAEKGLVTMSGILSRLAAKYSSGDAGPFDFIVVDEAQDIGVAQLRLLASLAGGRKNALFFAGDLGQRIFQQPFSWKAIGVDVRGRSSTLKINYRTSHQIRTQADRLLGPEVTDVDGNTETRKGTVSIFNGPPPVIQVLSSPDEECQNVARWLRERQAERIAPGEIGIFVRSDAELPRARAAAVSAGIPAGQATIGTMHLAKGLEFRAVVVMACDDEILPLQERIETATDQGELEEVYATERHLLYVACTRARDHLLVTGVEPASEFLADLAL